MARALIFDFDGTIADTETTLFQAYAEAYDAYGHVLDRDRWLSIIGTDDDWDPLHDLERLVGEPLPDAVHDQRRARRDELIAAAGVRPGVLRWLDVAETLGIPVGIASSSPIDWVERHLDRLGLLDRFACFACCNEVIPAKPDPTSYRLACEALHARPERSIAVEDSPHGIAAAKAAGLFTVATPHGLTEALDLSRADRVVASLAEIDLADLVVEMRPARPDEHDWLDRLHRAAVPNRRMEPGEDTPRRGGFAEIAVVDGTRVGAVHVHDGDTLVVERVEVLPEYQRAGVGTAMLTRIIDRAGGRDVTLRAPKSDPPRGLYERLGFAVERDTEHHHELRRTAKG